MSEWIIEEPDEPNPCDIGECENPPVVMTVTPRGEMATLSYRCEEHRDE